MIQLVFTIASAVYQAEHCLAEQYYDELVTKVGVQRSKTEPTSSRRSRAESAKVACFLRFNASGPDLIQ